MQKYKSPIKKLVSFFEQSRDAWKEKTIILRNEVKKCKNRIKFLEESKSKIKAELHELKEKYERLERTKVLTFKEFLEDKKKTK